LDTEVPDSDGETGQLGWDSWNSTAGEADNYGLALLGRNEAQTFTIFGIRLNIHDNDITNTIL
jgi:hypothetical protein